MGVFLNDKNALYVIPDKHPYEGHQKFFMDRLLPVGSWKDEHQRPVKKTACKFLDKVNDHILHYVIHQILLFEKKSGTLVRFDFFKVGQQVGDLFVIQQSEAPDGFIQLHPVNRSALAKHIKPQCMQHFVNKFLYWVHLDQTKGKWSAGNAMHALVFCHFTMACIARSSLVSREYPQFAWVDDLDKKPNDHWLGKGVNPHYLRNRSLDEHANVVLVVFAFTHTLL